MRVFDPAQPRFDGQQAQTVIQRFTEYNAHRIERTQKALSERQQVFLEVMTLLFHVNHEKLPGWVDHECPCGVARYQPGKDSLRAIAGITTGFQYQQRRSGQLSIKSLFLMGSCGSLGHSGGSDLDIWLCHNPSLSEQELAVLQQKCTAIEQWAETISLEVHFFLMDAEKFMRGERNDLDGEDCGSAQHQLLLDEFYRTAILLEGCYPLWWIVPPEYETHYEDYIEHMETQGFASPDEVIDFGGVGNIPPGEFVGAGMWQLYKAIGSPYKSILKLFLTEAYASDYPTVMPLSVDLKKRIYDFDTRLDALDPYLLLFDYLEAYLSEREEESRLDLVRRCIYFKCNTPMSQTIKRKHWKRELLKPLIRKWGWDEGHLVHLDNRPLWQVHTVMQERKLLVNELINSYKFLSRFGRQFQQETLLNAKDMTLLGHKLYATFDRKPGKVDFINPNISRDIQQEKLTLHLNREHVRKRIPLMSWSLFTGVERPGSAQHPLKKSASLIELLAWCHVNQVMAKGTQVVLYHGKDQGNDYELKEIISTFRKLPVANSVAANFEHSPVPQIINLYVNVFVDPMNHFTRRGIHKISNLTDSLGYSALKENLVLTIDQLVFNSWREVLATRYEGQNAMLRVIEDFLVSYPPGSDAPRPQLKVFCYCTTRAKAIAARVESLLEEIYLCFYQSKVGLRSRYVLQVGEEFHLIQFSQGRPVIYHYEKAGHLVKQLAKPQPHYSKLVLDSHALPGTVIAMICKNARPGRVQVYYLKEALVDEQHEGVAQIFVIDERGSLVKWKTPMYNEASLINPLNNFLRQVEYRQNRHRFEEPEAVQERVIEYYQVLLPEKNKPMRTRAIRPKEGLGQGRFFDVHAQVDFDSQNNIGFTLQCEQQEFSRLEHGDHVYKELVRYLVLLRKHQKPYPVYITDLSISDRLHNRNAKHVLQTASYLNYKHKLEAQLNKALIALYPSK